MTNKETIKKEKINGPFLVFAVFAENCWRQAVSCGENKTVEEAIISAKKQYADHVRIVGNIPLVVSNKQYGKEYWRSNKEAENDN